MAIDIHGDDDVGSQGASGEHRNQGGDAPVDERLPRSAHRKKDAGDGRRGAYGFSRVAARDDIGQGEVDIRCHRGKWHREVFDRQLSHQGIDPVRESLPLDESGTVQRRIGQGEDGKITGLLPKPVC